MFTWHLKQLPFQLLHMRELAETTVAANDTTAVRVNGGKDPARLPYRVDPADDADELYSVLILFGREVAEKIGGASPRALRERMWRGRTEPQGLPVCTPDEAFTFSGEIVRWLEACTHQIAHDETLHDAPDHLIDLIRKMRGRYPRAQPKFKTYRPRPCPTCGERALHATYEHSANEPTMRCDECRDSWPWKEYPQLWTSG